MANQQLMEWVYSSGGLECRKGSLWCKVYFCEDESSQWFVFLEGSIYADGSYSETESGWRVEAESNDLEADMKDFQPDWEQWQPCNGCPHPHDCLE